MGRKIALVAAILVLGVASVVLMGGESSNSYLWWGNHSPIYIAGDDDFTAANGVIGGSGSIDDPYIIAGWSIDVQNADYGIYIDHTKSYFVIKNCVIERARNAGIYLNSVENGRIERCELSINGIGIHLMNSSRITITGNAIARNRYGIVLDANARDNLIYGNSFIENGVSARDVAKKSDWYTGKTGNYWSDYTGSDKNGDGIGDNPYGIVFDPYPLMKPPAELTHFTPARGLTTSLPHSPQGYLVVSSAIPIVLEAQDPGSGVAKIMYSINNGKWQEYSGPFNLEGEDGVYKVSYYAVDHLGNAESVRTLTFLLDNHPPKTQISFGDPNYSDATGLWLTSNTPITLALTSKSTYGRTRTYFAIDGGPWREYSGPFHIRGADGPHTISYYSRNASGVAEKVKSITVYKDDTPPSTVGKGGAIHPQPAQSSSTAPSTSSSAQQSTQTPSTPSATVTAPAEVTSEQPTAKSTPVETTPVPSTAETAPATTTETESSSAIVSSPVTITPPSTPSVTTVTTPPVQTAESTVQTSPAG